MNAVADLLARRSAAIPATQQGNAVKNSSALDAVQHVLDLANSLDDTATQASSMAVSSETVFGL